MTQPHSNTSKSRHATHPRAKVGAPKELWRIEHCRIDEYKERIKHCEQQISALADKPCIPPYVGEFYDFAMTKIKTGLLIEKEQERLSLWLMLDEMNELARQGFEAWEAGYKGTFAFKKEYPDSTPDDDYLAESFSVYRATLQAADDKHIDIWDFLGPEIEDHLLPMKKYAFEFPLCPTCQKPTGMQGIFCKGSAPDQKLFIEVFPRCPDKCSNGYPFERLNGYRLETDFAD